jgi:hypothetical protein
MRDLSNRQPALGHLAQLLAFARAVLQAPAADGHGDADGFVPSSPAAEWRAAAVQVAETALWLLVAHLDAWGRATEAAAYDAHLAAGGGFGNLKAKKPRVDGDEAAVGALLLHVFEGCGLADGRPQPGSLLAVLRAAEATQDPGGAPFFADELWRVLAPEKAAVVGGDGACAAAGLVRLTVADRVAAAAEQKRERDAKPGGRGHVSASFDWT